MQSAEKGPDLSVSVQYAGEDDDAPPRRQVRRLLAAALGCRAEVTVRFVGREESARLNGRWRRREGATNVLSFGYGEDRGVLRGDIVVCAPVAREEAAARGSEPAAHYAHLLVHGALHLQGHAHDDPASAARMERRETEIRGSLGIPSPWEGEA